MKKIYIAFLYLIALSSNAEQFYINKSAAELRVLYQHDQLVSSSTDLLQFRVNIGALRILLTYQLHDGRSVGVAGTVENGKRTFSSSLSEYLTLVNTLASGGKIEETGIRLYGVLLAGPVVDVGDPPNYVRVIGKDKEGYKFSASLEGSDNERSAEQSIVTRYGFIIVPYVSPPRASL